MSLKKIDIFQWYVSDIFAHHQWLKHKHPEDLTKYSFNSISALFLLVLAYYDIQGFYHRPLQIMFGGYINRHKNIQRTSQSTQRMLCGHEKPSRTSIICDYHQGFVYASMYMDIWPNFISLTTSCRLLEAIKLTTAICFIHPTENKDRHFDNFAVTGGTLSCHYDKIVKLKVFFVFSGPFHAFVVGVLPHNMQKPDDLTAAIINTLSPNEVVMSD